MFRCWQTLQDKSGKCGLASIKIANLTYNQAKKMATDYQEAKLKLYEAFMRGDMGHWISMPSEQNSFNVSR